MKRWPDEYILKVNLRRRLLLFGLDLPVNFKFTRCFITMIIKVKAAGSSPVEESYI